MTNSKQKPMTNFMSAAEPDQLAIAVHHLAEHVQVLCDSIDELRSHFVWAVRNDRLRSADQTAAQPVLFAEEDEGNQP